MIARTAAFVWLLLIWTTLIGDPSPANMTMGLVVCAGLLMFFRPTRPSADPIRFRPLHAVRFAIYFAIKFTEANVQVALAVINPARVRRRRAIVAVPIVVASELATALLANAVSLTPGTFILEMRRDPGVLYVHILQLTSVRDARLSILEMERYILRAVGPRESIEQIDRLIAEVSTGPDEGRSA